jgi:hypothetical protein
VSGTAGHIEIMGGADPAVTAAIAAVVAHVERERARAARRPAVPPRPARWVEAWRPRPPDVPLPSHVYDAQPWAFEPPAHD